SVVATSKRKYGCQLGQKEQKKCKIIVKKASGHSGLPREKHIGKKYTKKIEGINTWFRTRLKRWAERTACFPGKAYLTLFNPENRHL
ncbi:MAG: hypothetical protein EOP42_28800, partial [Sphingobacteriaceae bacterium]